MIIAIVAIAIGVAAGYSISQYLVNSRIKSAATEAAKIISEAETKTKELTLTAKAEVLKIRTEAEEEAKRGPPRFAETGKNGYSTGGRRSTIALRAIEQRERKLEQHQSKMDKLRGELDKLHQKRLAELQRIAQLTQEEAKQLLLNTVEEEARQDSARIIREVEAEAKEEGERKARENHHSGHSALRGRSGRRDHGLVRCLCRLTI